MSPLSEYVSFERVYGPQAVTRFNLFNSTKVNVSMNPGYSSGDGISIVEAEAAKLANNYDIAYSGLTRE